MIEQDFFRIVSLIAFIFISVSVYMHIYPKYKQWIEKRKKASERKNTHIVVKLYLLLILLAPLVIFVLLKIGIDKAISELGDLKGFEKIPNWIWLLIIIAILISLIIYFRKYLFSKIPRPKTNWKWLWWIPIIVGLFFLVRWLYAKYVLEPKIFKEYPTVATPIYQRFDVLSENYVIAGQWYLLEKNEPLMSFASQDSSELNYSIVMMVDATRNWTRKTGVYKGKLFDKPTSFPEGYDDAKIGPAKIKFDRSTIVVVLKK